MKKDEKLIMVVKRGALFKNDNFQGFKLQDETDYTSRILDNFEYIKRGIAEKDDDYKQPIGYCMVVNPASKQVFAYQRASEDLNYFERRLQGKWSWGLGGHIEKIDSRKGNPIHKTLLRELKEEVDFNIVGTPRLLGYINDDDDDVGRVHFGILYVLETDSEVVIPKSLEIKSGRLVPVERLEEICLSPESVVEDWSRISLNPLKAYFQKTKLV
jgi:predicted NUDIX family phosphoesterase